MAIFARILSLFIALVYNTLFVHHAAILANDVAIMLLCEQRVFFFAFGTSLFVHVDLQRRQLIRFFLYFVLRVKN